MLLFPRGMRKLAAAALCFLVLPVSLAAARLAFCADGTVSLDDLIAEGLRNSPEILAAQARADAAGYRIPQAKSLPDPMFMFGYQNEGFQTLTIGRPDNPNAMGMSSLSQQFYFPGKRALQGRNGSEGRREPRRPLQCGEAAGWSRR